MFIQDKEQIKKFDIQNAKKFVDFWSRYYGKEKIETIEGNNVICYLDELNLDKGLTGQNVKRLLRWKNHRMLTEKKLSGHNNGQANEKVTQIIGKLKIINKFRYGKITENKFKEETKNIFPYGFVMQIFLFHIARPFEYPIADSNVFLAYSVHKQEKIPNDWDRYKDYREYFFEIVKSAKIITEKPKGNEDTVKDIVAGLKKVDNALFAFGKFLNFYGKNELS